MATDARISVGLPGHPKTKKLIRRLGQAAGWNLVCLLIWAAANRSDGDLSGMSAEDIELAAEWDGEEGKFVAELVAVRFLDGESGEYVVHNWAEHNPWAAGSEKRSLKGKWNSAKRHHGEAEADRMYPEYAAIRNASSNADSKLPAKEQQGGSKGAVDDSNPPSPYPNPSPLPSPTPTPTLKTSAKRRQQIPEDFYPNALGVAKCMEANLGMVTELDGFRNYHKAKGTLMLDWQAAWLTWIEKAVQYGRGAKPVQQMTVPGPRGPDPALAKLDADAKVVRPPQGAEREALASMRKLFTGAMQ